VTVLTGFGLLPNFIDLMNAYSGGHFAKAGLDAKVLGANGTAREMQQMIAGQAQFGRVAALDQMNAVAKQGVPFIAIATLCQGSSFLLVSPKDKPISDAAALKGKIVGVVSVGGTTEMLLDLILQKVGIAKDDVKREAVGDNPGALEFVQRGRIDCFITSLNSVVAIERAGGAIEYWSTDRYAPMPGQVYLTTAAVIAQQPDMVRRFLRAMKGSVDELLSQPTAPIFARAQKDFDIPGLKDMDAAVAIQKATAEKLWLVDGKDNLLRNVPARWKSGVETLRGAGVADLKDPDALYTNRFIDEVLKG
jgi:NitT/TauT family transport system substrate-binding protein